MRNSASSSASATCSNSARDSFGRPSALEPLVVADLRADPLELLALQPPHELGRDRRAVVLERAPVADPLPHLRARDLGGRRVLHQPVDAGGAVAAQPRRDVLDADVDVVAQPGLGDVARAWRRRRAARRRRRRRRRAGGRPGWGARRGPRRTPPWRSAPSRGARPRCRRSRRPPRAPCRRAPPRSRARWPPASLRDGISAAMPPIACAPRRWQVLTSSSRVGAHERHGHRHVVAVGQDELRPLAEAS